MWMSHGIEVFFAPSVFPIPRSGNTRSIRVWEKLGFTHEGTLRANTFEKGEFVDEAVFGLLREEWSDSGVHTE